VRSTSARSNRQSSSACHRHAPSFAQFPTSRLTRASAHYIVQNSTSIPEILNNAAAQHVSVLPHYIPQGAAGGHGCASQHMNMAIKRHPLARLRFAWRPGCIFAKLVTKVAKQSSLKVVLLQSTEENRSARDRHDDQTAPRLHVRIGDQSAR
jgi:hypothetical protein